jgi:hypothetical protein|nr:MAG TPA: hypothetical protein [Caudoviricetes sp.]
MAEILEIKDTWEYKVAHVFDDLKESLKKCGNICDEVDRLQSEYDYVEHSEEEAKSWTQEKSELRQAAGGFEKVKKDEDIITIIMYIESLDMMTTYTDDMRRESVTYILTDPTHLRGIQKLAQRKKMFGLCRDKEEIQVTDRILAEISMLMIMGETHMFQPFEEKLNSQAKEIIIEK